MKKDTIEKTVSFAAIFLTISFFLVLFQVIFIFTTGNMYFGFSSRPKFRYYSFIMWFIPLFAFIYTINSLVKIKTLFKTLLKIKLIWIIWLVFFLIETIMGIVGIIFYLKAIITKIPIVLNIYAILYIAFFTATSLITIIFAWIVYNMLINKKCKDANINQQSNNPPNSNELSNPNDSLNLPKY